MKLNFPRGKNIVDLQKDFMNLELSRFQLFIALNISYYGRESNSALQTKSLSNFIEYCVKYFPKLFTIKFSVCYAFKRILQCILLLNLYYIQCSHQFNKMVDKMLKVFIKSCFNCQLERDLS